MERIRKLLIANRSEIAIGIIHVVMGNKIDARTCSLNSTDGRRA